LSFSVAILCFNEDSGLLDTYTTYKKVLTDLGSDYEFIIINDGSTDRTAQVATKIQDTNPNVTIVTNKKPQGAGNSFKKGLKKASKEFYMFTGGYNALSEGNVRLMISNAKEQDITLAYISNPEIREKFRRIQSTLFTSIMNFFTGMNLQYYNAMHISRTMCLRSINIRSNQQTFSAECVVKLIKHKKCSFVEVPVTVNFSQKRKKNIKSKLRKISISVFDAFRFFYFLFYDLAINNKISPKKDS
jgi:glycosyltransferase involved in cell wall biosynthesis